VGAEVHCTARDSSLQGEALVGFPSDLEEARSGSEGEALVGFPSDSKQLALTAKLSPILQGGTGNGSQSYWLTRWISTLGWIQYLSQSDWL